jgi:lipoprotein-anchoring transpeptidase ErfK/SrfK
MAGVDRAQGKITPPGEWTAQWLSRNHRSSRYNNAPMPYAIFYSGHYAIHGTDQISRLGRPASAGCVRLHPDNARVLFRWSSSRRDRQHARRGRTGPLRHARPA